WLFYLALTAGFATLFIWLLLGYSFDVAVERMVTVMVITCPHALGLAAPLVVAVSTAISAKKGLLIRNCANFEGARNLNVVDFGNYIEFKSITVKGIKLKIYEKKAHVVRQG